MKTSPCPSGASAADYLPRKITLATLATAAAGCQGCALYCRATQVVFGQGPARARLMMVGEQPGDQEDRAGKPFVGPAGRVLDQALEAAGIDRARVYLTNAVKHFKWEARGKRRLHAKPSWTETRACRPWLMEEIRLVEPAVIVCLGATAAQSLMGTEFRLTQHRRELLVAHGRKLLATIHPSAILRMPDSARAAARAGLIADLRMAAAAAEEKEDSPAKHRSL